MLTKRVRDIMSPTVVTTSPTTPLAVAAQQMMEVHVSGLPVVDAAGRPVGMLSQSDLVDHAHNDDRRSEPEKGFYRALRGRPAPEPTPRAERLVEEVMTPLTLHISPDATVETAARLMALEGVHRLVVLESQRVIGIVSSMDIVRAVAGLGNPAVPRA